MLILALFDAGKAVTDGLRLLGSFLCKAIYWLIANLYELFMNLSSVQFLQQSNLKPIYQRVTLILAIIMIFYVTFQTVKYIIEPDSATDKENGASSVVRRMIIVVVLIAMVPQIFSLAYTLQNSLLKNQIFSKIILGKEQVQVDKFGRSFSANIFSMFYFVDGESWDSVDDVKCGGAKCQTIVDMNLSTLQSEGTLPYLEVGLTETAKQTDPSGENQEIYGIRFEWLLAVGVGGFICYMLILYCIDAGTRVAQLAFLQIIAPIPIIGYLTPKKDGIFEKWTKQCLTTYLDLFLRVSIIYVVLFITEILGEAYRNKTLINGMTGSTWMNIFMYVALVLGLLTFAKRAPGILSELFPSMSKASGTLGLGLKGRTEGITNLGKGASKVVKGAAKTVGMGRRITGAAGGYIAGLASGGGLKGAKEGAKTGFSKDNKGLLRGSAINRVRQGFNAGAKVRQNRADIKAAGGKPWEAEHRKEHFQNVAQEQDRKVNLLESLSKKKDAVTSAIGGVKFRKQMDSMGESIRKFDPAAGKSWDGKKKSAEKLARQFAHGDITIDQFKDGMNNLVKDFNNEQRKNAINRIRSETIEQAKQQYIANGGSIETFDESTVQFDESTVDLSKVVQASEFTDEDLEIEGDVYSANWATVATALDSAQAVVDEIQRQGIQYTTQDANGNKVTENVATIGTKTNARGETVSNIADVLGNITDNAQAAVDQTKTSPDYLRAHANAKGADNK